MPPVIMGGTHLLLLGGGGLHVWVPTFSCIVKNPSPHLYISSKLLIFTLLQMKQIARGVYSSLVYPWAICPCKNCNGLGQRFILALSLPKVEQPIL